MKKLHTGFVLVTIALVLSFISLHHEMPMSLILSVAAVVSGTVAIVLFGILIFRGE